MATYFELHKSKDEQFRFALKTDDGSTLLISEGYGAKASAQSGIAAVRSNCGQDARYEKKTASSGKFFFNLKSGNQQIVASSPMHATEDARDAAIAVVKRDGAMATVNDVT